MLFPTPSLLADMSNILVGGMQDARKVSQTWNHNWNVVFGGGSAGGQTLYAAITNLGLLFAVVALIISGVRVYSALNDSRPIDLVALLWAVLAISLFAGQGALLATCILQLRSVINQVSDGVLAGTLSGIKLDEALKQLQGGIAFKSALEGLYKPCLSMQGQEQIDCLKGAADQADILVNAFGAAFGPMSWLGDLVDRFKNAFSAVGSGNSFSLLGLFSPVWQPIVYSVLYWCMQAYQHLLEAVLLVVGLMAPLAVGGSLYFFGVNSIIAWLTGFFSVGMAKICFNILVGLAAVTATNSGVNDPGWFPLFVGIFAPVISFSLASGSGLVVWTAFTSIVGGTVATGASAVTTGLMRP
ncbi:MAG: hypothetical protein N5P05_002702 [Chroococcopsis gigantea SAG 12.99]|jgi:hypothetical protein|nr:hypothetical protein [Chlorogloea purpurea SAG 13.99]MDV3001096.1 hypothetical protein [Chroococcopsis gigantea SAG 12.99]